MSQLEIKHVLYVATYDAVSGAVIARFVYTEKIVIMAVIIGQAFCQMVQSIEE
ncbi:MAG: hypothetical protein ACI9T7_002686 [Oleiphilaceae bacterium]|jgi:hypothetical protein